MPPFSRFAIFGLTVLGLGACGAAPLPAPGRAADSAPPPPRERLMRIVDAYWDERSAAPDVIEPQSIADALSLEGRYLREIMAIPRSGLDRASQLTYDVFKRQRALAVEGATYPAELMPLNPFAGTVQDMAIFAADTRDHPFTTAADYANWLRRIDGYVRWTRQAIANMREGMRRGYTSPRALVERMLPILERLGRDDSANVFYTPLRAMSDRIRVQDRAELTKELSRATSHDLLPANRALHDFLLQEYLPRTRSGLALSELPLGPAWYAYRLKRAVGGEQTPDEIHRVGIAEVERLRQRMQALRVEMPAAATAGDAPPRVGGRDSAAVLDAYNDLAVQVDAAAPNLFAALPKAGLDIRATEFATDPTLALRYRPAGPAGSPPAILYVSAVSVPGYLREGIPGLHYQNSLQQGTTDLPRFRRFGTDPAYVEGWGLYAASLGEQLGLYPDSAVKLAALADELRCAVALVVDTGIHAQAWTRVQALEYLHGQLSIDDAGAQAMIDSYAANPADGLACKIGEMKIEALRLRAQQALGAKFDIREFHTEILKDGAVPIDILQAQVNAWIEASR